MLSKFVLTSRAANFFSITTKQAQYHSSSYNNPLKITEITALMDANLQTASTDKSINTVHFDTSNKNQYSIHHGDDDTKRMPDSEAEFNLFLSKVSTENEEILKKIIKTSDETNKLLEEACRIAKMRKYVALAPLLVQISLIIILIIAFLRDSSRQTHNNKRKYNQK